MAFFFIRVERVWNENGTPSADASDGVRGMGGSLKRLATLIYINVIQTINRIIYQSQ